jgi:hypothetical protein
MEDEYGALMSNGT